tara:strand:- start:243 stop:671 length:429 start_codon:yes stop_codon:yes gene_type:complete
MEPCVVTHGNTPNAQARNQQPAGFNGAMRGYAWKSQLGPVSTSTLDGFNGAMRGYAWKWAFFTCHDQLFVDASMEPCVVTHGNILAGHRSTDTNGSFNGAMRGYAWKFYDPRLTCLAFGKLQWSHAWLRMEMTPLRAIQSFV